MPDEPTWRPHPTLLRVVAYAACLLVLGAAAWLLGQVLALLGLVLFPVVVATFLARVLDAPVSWLRRRGWRPAPAAAVSLLGFLLAVAGLIAVVAPPMVNEFRDLGPTVEEGLGEIEDWLVEDTELDITRADIEEAKDDLGDRVREVVEDSQSEIAQGARLVLSGLAGLILALVLTFFMLKDGPDAQQWALRWIPERRRPDVTVAARAGWAALGGYLRGAALLGLVEAVIIGITMALVGAHLVIPVMLLTFAAAFIPLVGATVAGIIAVLVTLASVGLFEALIVGIVAVLVQQFDNDLLAPWIYGKALALHPVVILLSITTGTALFGFIGTVVAVPVTAVAVSATAAVRERRGHRLDATPGP